MEAIQAQYGTNSDSDNSISAEMFVKSAPSISSHPAFEIDSDIEEPVVRLKNRKRKVDSSRDKDEDYDSVVIIDSDAESDPIEK